MKGAIGYIDKAKGEEREAIIFHNKIEKKVILTLRWSE